MIRHGAILIDKPRGTTSAQVVAKMKRTFALDAVGHAGTLDPDATGLLVVLCGKATKLQDWLLCGKKEYTGEFLLGLRTDTDDSSGKIINEQLYQLPEGALFEQLRQKLIEHFGGPQEQKPPAFSAKRVDGVRSYQAALKGQTLELRAQVVNVEFISLDRNSSNRLAYRVQVSKGTYIRSLARDIGDFLGCGGCTDSIRRTMSAPFSVAEAVSLDDAVATSDLTDILIPIGKLLENLPRLEISVAEHSMLKNGDQRPLDRFDATANLADLEQQFADRAGLYLKTGELCGLALQDNDRWRLNFLL